MPQVLMPREKPSDLSELAQAISIAGSVYGLYNKKQELDLQSKILKEKDADKDKETARDFLGKNRKEKSDAARSGLYIPKNLYPRGINQEEGFDYAPAGKDEKPAYEHETTLRKEYDSAPVKKDTDVILSAYDKIKAETKKDGFKQGVGDMSIIYAYMKMLDPGSTVREGEYATAENAGGLDGKARNYINKLIEGQKLDDATRQSFIDHAGTLKDAQLLRVKDHDERFKDIANNTPGVNFQRVLDPKYEKAYKNLKGSAKSPIEKFGGTDQQITTPKAAPGSIVEINGIQYKVESDGDTLTEIKK